MPSVAGAQGPSRDEALARCEELIDYRFSNRLLLQEALTHASIAANYLDSNERLEFLGDAVLGLVVCEELFRRYPTYHEGDLTRVKSVVVSRQTCARVAEELGLDRLIFLSKGVEDEEGLPANLVGSALESLIGAVYLDGGFEAAAKLILRLVEPEIQLVAGGQHELNYKSMLQQHAQRQFGAAPNYEVLDEKGPDHSKCFEVAVILNGHRYPSGWGLSKKEAEQKAARCALEVLGAVEPDEDSPQQPCDDLPDSDNSQ